MKNYLFSLSRIVISILFFFTFWTGGIYLTDVIFSGERFYISRFLSGLFMAIVFTYFTDCGNLFIKSFLKHK